MSEAPNSFAYSGRHDVRTLLVLPFHLAVGAALALLYQWLLDLHPIVLLNVFAPLPLAAGIGAIGVSTLRMGHVRSRGVAILATALIAAFVLVVAHLLALGVLEQGFTGAWEALGAKLEDGDPIPRRPRSVPPGLLVVGWFFEALTAIGLGIGLALTWWNRAVYSEAEGRFVSGERLARRYTDEPAQLRRKFETGGWEALAGQSLATAPEHAEMGEIRARLFRCPEGPFLNVEWRGRLPGPRGRKVMRQVLVLRRVRVEAESLGRWMNL